MMIYQKKKKIKKKKKKIKNEYTKSNLQIYDKKLD